MGFSKTDGTGAYGVLAMAEALGENEELDGLPLRPYAQGGAIFERAIRRASTEQMPLSREGFMVSNILSCRPPENKLEHQPYEHSAISHCEVHRNRTFQDFLQRCKGNPNVKTPVILAMGGVAFRTLTGISGKKQGVSHMRGYPFHTPAGLVIPTFHPAFVSRTRKTLGVLIHDILRAVRIAKYGFTELPLKYQTDPTETEIRDFKARVLENPNVLVSFDIETANISNTRREWPDWYSIQFSLAPGTGIFFNVEGTGLEYSLDTNILNQVIKPVLASQNPKVTHNGWRYDLRVLRERYKLEINGRQDDTMWMFHHWEPDLTIESTKEDGGGDRASLSTRAGLQFAASFFGMTKAWKHLNESDPKHYGICDVDACQRIMAVLPEWMKQRKVWDGYDRYCRQFDPKLMELSRRGIPIDNDGRLALHDVLQSERKVIDADLQANYPEILMSCDPKVGLANEPKWFEAGGLDEPRKADEKYRRVFALGGVQTGSSGDVGASTGGGEPAAVPNAHVVLGSGGQDAEHFYFDDDPFWDAAENKEDFAENKADGFDALNSERGKTPEQIAEAALAGSPDDDAEINRLTPVKGVWRKMVKRSFDVEIAEIKKCECLVFIPKLGKKGQELKAGKWMTSLDAAVARGEAPPAVCPVCMNTGKFRETPRKERQERWARLKPFKASKDQLIRYIKFKGWKVPFDRKKKKETTAAKEIDRLQKKTGDKLLGDVLVARATEKADSTYVMGWTPWEDGRVHSEFGFGPATGQLNSKGPNCFSDDTEVLTIEGWKLFADIQSDMRLAQYDEASGAIDFAVPEAHYSFPYKGEMRHITTEQQIDLLVTPEHDCLLRRRKGDHRTFRVMAAAYKTDDQQIQAGRFVGGDVSLAAHQVTLIAALQADGYVHKPIIDARGRHRGNGGHLQWTLWKPRKVERLRAALAAAGIRATEYPKTRAVGEKTNYPNGILFYVNRDAVPEWLRGKKFFGSWLLSLDRATLDMFAEEIWFWDGMPSQRSMYSSSIKENTDWAQIITILSGRRAKVRRYHNGNAKSNVNWQVDASDGDYSLTSNCSNESVACDGRVYCVTMPKHTVIVRRNGRVAITGQCQNRLKHIRFERLKPLKLPMRFGKLIKARPGHKLLNFDLKSFHILTLGYAAKDPLYCKMARVDMHTYFSSHILTAMGILKEPINAALSEAELLPICGALKKKTFIKLGGVWAEATKDQINVYVGGAGAEILVVKDLRDQRAKPAILGKGLCMSANRLYNENQEYFTDKAQAEYIMGRYDATFPKVIQFQGDIAMKAHAQKYLVSEHGFLRRFWDVFQFKYLGPKEYVASHGEDYEDAVSFLVQNPAHCHLRDTIFWLEEQGDWLNRANWINTVHDSLEFECPDALVEEAIPTIKGIMEQKSKVLVDPTVAPDGLWCQAEVSVGLNISPYDKVDNPDGMQEVKI